MLVEAVRLLEGVPRPRFMRCVFTSLRFKDHAIHHLAKVKCCLLLCLQHDICEDIVSSKFLNTLYKGCSVSIILDNVLFKRVVIDNLLRSSTLDAVSIYSYSRVRSCSPNVIKVCFLEDL